MKVFIFAIGGTGSRVLRSLSMLMAAGVEGLNSKTQIYPLIIDYDKENGDKTRTLEHLNNYSEIHELVYSNHRDNYGAFGCPLYQMKGHMKGSNSTFVFNHNDVKSGSKYSDIINYNDLTGDKTPTKQLIESLYNIDVDQEHTELHIDTEVGFKGNPNIGSVILNDLINTDTYRDFCNYFQSGDRIIIVGSIFGGTGSSGIPVLVRHLRSDKVKKVIQDAPISTVLVTPYFNIKDPDSEERKEGVIDSKLFNSKTKAALNYYKVAIHDKVSSIYYVGDKKFSQLSHKIGRKEQKNPANIVELLSAMSIVHFISRSEDMIKNDGAQNEWKFAMPTNVDLPNTNELYIKDFDSTSRAKIFNYLTALAYSMKYVKEYVEDNPKDINDKPFYKQLKLDEIAANVKAHKKSSEIEDGVAYKGLMQTLEALHVFYDNFKDWVKELGDDANGHKLNLFNFDEEFHKIIYGDEKSEQRSFGPIKRNVILLEKEDFDRDINDAFKGYIDPKAKNTLNESPYQYMFMTALFNGCKGHAGIIANEK